MGNVCFPPKALKIGVHDEQSELLVALHTFLRQGTMHLELSREDLVAYEKLRLMMYDWAKKDGISQLPVFEVALFLSMSAKCGTLLHTYKTMHTAFEKYAKTKNEKEEQAKAKKAFIDAVLLAHYRYSRKMGGFSVMCTFVVLGQHPFVCSIEDRKTQTRTEVVFGPAACWMQECVEPNDDIAKKKAATVMDAAAKEEAAAEQRAKKKQLDKELDPMNFEVRIRNGTVAHVKGTDHRCMPLDCGMGDHFRKWLDYTKTFRSSLELPQVRLGETPEVNTVEAVVGLLMEFDVGFED